MDDNSRLGAESYTLRDDDGMQGLTGKQFQFANLVVQGVPKIDAYARVYDVSDMKRESIGPAAHALSRNPKVAAKIEQLRSKIEEQTTLAPSLSREWVLDGIMGLARNSQKDSVRLQSYIALGKVAGIDLFRETTRVERVTRTPEELDAELQQRLAEMAKTIEAKANPPVQDPKPRDRRRKPST